MLQRIHLPATLFLLLVAAVVAYAQEPARPVRRGMSLGERLEAFRKNLIGADGAEMDSPQAAADSAAPPAGRYGSNLLGGRMQAPATSGAGAERIMTSRRPRAVPNTGGRVSGRPMQGALPQRQVTLQERLSAMRDPGTTAGASTPIVIPSEDDVRRRQPATGVAGRSFGQPTPAVRPSAAGGGPAEVRPTEAFSSSQPAPEFLDAAPRAPSVEGRAPLRTAALPAEPSSTWSSAGESPEDTLPESQPAEAETVEPAADQPAVQPGIADAVQLEATGPSFSDAPLADQPAAEPEVAAAEPEPEAANRPNVLISRRSPVLMVDVSGAETVVVGKSSSYTVSIENIGEVAAQDVVVTVMVPAWADLVEIRPSVGNAGNPVAATENEEADHYEPLQWRINRLEAHSRQQMLLRLVPRKSRRFDLAVQWTFSPITSQAVVEVQEPKLEMSISGPQEVFYGERKIYKLSLANPGTGDAENVTVHVQVGSGQDQTATDKLAVLRAGESKVIELELEARQAGALVIQAYATGDGGLQTAVSEEITVRRAALAIAVDAPQTKYARSETIYRVRVGNPGNAAAENIRVAANLPPGAEYLSSTRSGHFDPQRNQVTWFIANMRPQTEVALDLVCVLNEPGENRLRAEAQATGELSAVGGTVTMVEALADLKLEVKDPPGAVPVGDEAIYEVVIRNRGTKQAEQIEAFAYFSPGIEPIAVDGAQARIVAGEGLVEFAPIASLPAGGEVHFTVRAKAERPGNHVFRGEVLCKPLEIKLAADEITRFYVGSRVSEPAASVQAAPVEAGGQQPAAAPVPIPEAEKQPTPGEPLPEQN